MREDRRHSEGHANTAAEDTDSVAPGRVSRSALLRKPDQPVASGLVQRKERDGNGVRADADHAVSAASSSSGSPLPATLMRKFESSLSADLSGVRVHTGDASASASEALGARAYTLGNDIHFGRGQFDPHSASGEHLLAHEVAHTVQQAGGAARTQLKLEVSSPGDAFEHEADRAADAMVAGQSFALSSTGAGVHRLFESGTKNVSDKEASQKVDNDEASFKEEWETAGGPQLLKIVRAEIAAWETYRAKPETGKVMPGRTLMAGILLTQPFDSALREYASRQLGSHGLAVLEEMMAMNHSFFGLSERFNVKERDVKHHYEIEFGTTATGANATIRYSNDLPSQWSWTSPPVHLTGLNFAFEISFSADQLKDKLKDPKRWGEIVKVGKPWPPKVAVDVNGTMSTDSVAYWGWNDFAGRVQIVNAPTGGISSILGGGKFSTGMTISFLGGPGKALSCDDFEAKASTTGAAKGLKGSLKAGTGMAEAIVDNADAAVQTKDISAVTPLVDAEREWKVHVEHFANGSAAVPPNADVTFKLLVPAIQKFVDREFNDPRRAEELKKRGIDPRAAFSPTITLEGWASMRWKAASSPEEQAKKNLELSQQRADAVANALMGIWQWPTSAVIVHARGEGIQNPSTNEAESGAKAKAKVAHLSNEISKLEVELKTAPSASEKAEIQAKIDKLKSELEDYKGLTKPGSDSSKDAYEEWIRQVAITVRWAGKVLDLGASSEPK